MLAMLACMQDELWSRVSYSYSQCPLTREHEKAMLSANMLTYVDALSETIEWCDLRLVTIVHCSS